MSYRAYVASALLYPLPETNCLTDSSCSPTSAHTTPACAGSPAWAGGRMVPFTRQFVWVVMWRTV
eukprot:363474-Chlamydomonas_euryale.AAC.4